MSSPFSDESDESSIFAKPPSEFKEYDTESLPIKPRTELDTPETETLLSISPSRKRTIGQHLLKYSSFYISIINLILTIAIGLYLIHRETEMNKICGTTSDKLKTRAIVAIVIAAVSSILIFYLCYSERCKLSWAIAIIPFMLFIILVGIPLQDMYPQISGYRPMQFMPKHLYADIFYGDLTGVLGDTPTVDGTREPRKYPKGLGLY